jgi:hypothetical protein
MRKIRLSLLALVGLAMSVLAGADFDLLTQLSFVERTDLAGGSAPRTIKEPTTGIVIELAPGTTGTAYSMQKLADGGYKWHLTGEISSIRRMIYTAKLPDVDLGAWRFYRLKVRSLGLRRSFVPQYKVLTCGDLQLLESGNVFNDGKVHTLGGIFDKGKLPSGGELQLTLETDNSELDFELLEFTLTNDLPGDDKLFQAATKEDWQGYKPIDLQSLCNGESPRVFLGILEQRKMIVDFPQFPGREVKQRVPFQLASEQLDYVKPPFDPNRTKKDSVVMGGNVVKNEFFPRTRCDEIVVPLSGQTAEIYAILGCDMPACMTRYVAPTIPYQFADVDCFGIQLDYADGTSDVCVPRHLNSEGFVIQGTAAAYAIPVDMTKELKAIRFQNRFMQHQIGLMALTLNDGAPLLIANELRNPPARVMNQGRSVQEKPLAITRDAKKAVFENAHYRVEFDLDGKFVISSIVNYHAPDMKVNFAPGCFEIQDGAKMFTGESFVVKEVTEVAGGLKFLLQCKTADCPSDLELTFTGDAGDELRLSSTLVNDSDRICNADFRFPALNRIVLDNLNDTYYYFPKMRVVNSNAVRSFHTPVNERAYHVQFMDVYNPVAGGGIGLHTRDLTMATFDYGLSKTGLGVRFYINNLGNWNKSMPHTRVPLAETALQFHGGDWHQALQAYQNWLKTWFKVYPTNLSERWKNAYFMHGESPFKTYYWQCPFYDEKTQTFFWEEAKQNTLDYIGHKTDLMGISFWNYPENGKERTTNGGNFDDGEYDPANYLTGRDNLKKFFEQVQSEGTAISLYTIATYLPKSSRLGQEIGTKVGQVPGSGNGIVQDSKVIFPCLQQWQDYYAKAICRVQKELEPDAIYMDCYPFGKYSSACFSKEHGHEVPQQLNRTQHSMLVKVREGVANNTALFVEDPPIDYDAGYLSGNLTYYCTTIHEHRAKSYDINDAAERDFYAPIQNIQHFTMPHLKQFCFPCGWVRSGPVSSEVNAIFFNGEGVDDAGWVLFDEHYRPRLRHWLQIQYALNDCFSSLVAEPQVQTAVGEIYANKFPGHGRTLWTLWNARFATYRGVVLEVPYKEGAKYYDVWNVREIVPELADGKARLSISDLAPQGLGGILEYFGDLPEGLPTTTVAEKEATQVEPR